MLQNISNQESPGTGGEAEPTTTETASAVAGSHGGPVPRPTRAPSRAGYWIGGVVGLCGAIVAIALAVSGIAAVSDLAAMSDEIDDFERIGIPGERAVTLSEGEYTVFYEAAGASDEANPLPGFSVSLTPTSGGDAVSLDDYEGSLTYNLPGREGWALWTFQVEEPATYVVVTSLDGDGDADDDNLAIGRDPINGLFGRLLAAAAVGISGIAVALVSVLITLRRRRRRV